jgi:nitronate monooxygenase
MEFLRSVKLIQGGMGAYVSNWRPARAVAMESSGETAGTVSGTALDVIYVRLLQLGDPGGYGSRTGL